MLELTFVRLSYERCIAIEFENTPLLWDFHVARKKKRIELAGLNLTGT